MLELLNYLFKDITIVAIITKVSHRLIYRDHNINSFKVKETVECLNKTALL
ncbi:hypothetical protein [Mycoplasma sp. P36-A1]|uniref:hypothetical protein n=1 Tax=Mycoplasma sp. P36-A1 TaxID=3252900 RepID=UPI003C2F3935